MSETVPTAGAPARQPTRLWAYIALAAAALFWGGNWPLARWIQSDVPPLTLGLLRWGSAAIFLLPFALPQFLRAWPKVRREWRRLTILGLVGVTGFSAMSYTGLAYTTAINGSLLNAAAPAFLVLFAALGFGRSLGERVGWAQVGGVALSIAGVLAIISRGAPETLASLAFNVGDLWVMGAVLVWSIYTVLLKRWPSQVPPLSFLLATILFSLPLPIVLCAAELAWGARVPPVNTATVLTTIYLGLFPSIAAYAFWGYGVGRIGPTYRCSRPGWRFCCWGKASGCSTSPAPR
jgi:drug/metabolite transporter (DMT)-like permease